MEINLTRTAHAIGQGGFCSELFEWENGNRFLTVYDCGSDSLDTKARKKRINSDLCEKKTGNRVDLLVISHFDRDHFNGIEYLNPEVIIIPLLTPKQRIMLSVFSAMEDRVYNTNLPAILHQMFPEARIIEVRPPTEEDTYRQRDREGESTTVDSLPTGSTIASGERISIPQKQKQHQFWQYQFYNPDLSEVYKIFKNLLIGHGLDVNKLEGPGSEIYIKRNMSKLKKVYKDKQLANINDHSLLTYSSPSHEVKEIWMKIPFHPYVPFVSHYNRYHHTDGAAAFYWGDMTCIDNLTDKVIDCLHPDSPLSFVQVPHHGSYRSYSNSIFTSFTIGHLVSGVIQTGIGNRHGHPSSWVVGQIQRHALPVLVTQQENTCFVQSISLKT